MNITYELDLSSKGAESMMTTQLAAAIAMAKEWGVDPAASIVGIAHPDLGWARALIIDRKNGHVTEAELSSLRWNQLMGCYTIGWRGMCLGIETDGHIHS